ncbi:GNAT family N-acetyltransferase [Aggregatimonas sangjinii]|uniref:GNAT family N-acetyltransferase n=2 Tax=Aggregatimonas sangjinii TaxID=2583587 RepID=A0A5B7T037_9FLAO|nr:GNAT family N-acetyltransferase [Aggregatimonas sangjinii]
MISGEYFTIDVLQLSDAPSLSKMMVENRSRFQRFFPYTLAQNLTPAASEEYIQRKKKQNTERTEFTWTIRDKKTTKIAGLIILKELDWKRGVGELAYCIGQKFEGLGWVTRTVETITKYAFSELRLRTLQIITHKTNIGSIRVAEKCGFQWQKKLVKSYTAPDGIALDMELYERYTDPEASGR